MTATAADRSGLLERRAGLVATLIVAALTVLAWSNRFVQDDAFISFRYARNLAQGLGLVWNEGYRVEGYSNFLWTMLMAVPHRLGWDPVGFSYAVGIASFVASLGLTYQLAARVLSSKSAALMTVLLLGTNYTFSCYATGGLETQLDTALVLGAVYLLARATAARRWSVASAFGVSGLLALSVLTRPDSLLLAAVILPAGLLSVRSSWEASPAQRRAVAAALVVPFVAAISAFALWKLVYYGSLPPNSYYVKLATSVSYQRGLRYVWSFLTAYWLVPVPVALLLLAGSLARPSGRALLVPAVLVAVWTAYVVHASGDFMEFRFLVPVLPYFFLLTAWAIGRATRRRAAHAGVLVLLAYASWHHARTFQRTDDFDGIRFSASLLEPDGANWIGIGRALGADFADAPDVTIAVTAAGAIPYASGLRTIDMLGINDLWIARHGSILSQRPGHQRIATLDYLIQSGVHLVIGHPFLVAPGFAEREGRSQLRILKRLSMPVSTLDQLPDEAQFVEIPVDADRSLLVVYLVRNPHVDEAIRRNGWLARSVRDGDGNRFR